MGLLNLTRMDRLAPLLAAALAVIAAWPAAAQTSIKFSLDGRLEGLAATFFLPQDRGYFGAPDLNVTVDEATTALEPITRVASGAYQMGLADINTLIKYRDQHPSPPVRAVFMLYNKPPFAIVARRSRGITEPKELEGKKLGAPPADGAYAQWPIFVQANSIDASKVTIVSVGFPVREPMLASGEVDAITGFSFSSYINLKDRGVPADDISVLLMADHGVNLYGNTIMVNPKFAAEKPEAVKGFLRAFLQGLKEIVHRPAEAVDSIMRRDDTVKRDVELERLRMAIRDNIVTPEVRANGFGAVDFARLAESIDQIGLVYTFKAKPKAEDIFDASFLPPASERKVH